MNIKDKIKNPYFWFGLVSTIAIAANIDLETLTSWALLGEALEQIVMNPVKIGAIIVNVTAILVNHNTKGLKD